MFCVVFMFILSVIDLIKVFKDGNVWSVFTQTGKVICMTGRRVQFSNGKCLAHTDWIVINRQPMESSLS